MHLYVVWERHKTAISDPLPCAYVGSKHVSALKSFTTLPQPPVPRLADGMHSFPDRVTLDSSLAAMLNNTLVCGDGCSQGELDDLSVCEDGFCVSAFALSDLCEIHSRLSVSLHKGQEWSVRLTWMLAHGHLRVLPGTRISPHTSNWIPSSPLKSFLHEQHRDEASFWQRGCLFSSIFPAALHNPSSARFQLLGFLVFRFTNSTPKLQNSCKCGSSNLMNLSRKQAGCFHIRPRKVSSLKPPTGVQAADLRVFSVSPHCQPEMHSASKCDFLTWEMSLKRSACLSATLSHYCHPTGEWHFQISQVMCQKVCLFAE